MSRTAVDHSKTAEWKVSDISRKYPTHRNAFFISVESWLSGKRKDDEAEGLWRIKNNLYDLTAFVDQHPGGSFWLQQTKGTDITEPFETHHLSTKPEKMLEKFKVRPAAAPRNYALTMHDNGFYKILKSRVRKSLDTLDYSPCKRTNHLHMGLLIATFVLSLASVLTGRIIFELLAAFALCWLSIAAHNFFHRKDNWQMYTFNLTLMNFSTWRISHALSHHVYPNSLLDLEMSFTEPFLCWLPNEHFSSKVQRAISVFIQPIVYAAVFPFQFMFRLISSIVATNVMYWHDIIGFILPTAMLIVSDASFCTVLRQWLFIIVLASFIFGVIAFNAGHHDPRIYHDGDAIRQDRDWGLYQMDTIIDRSGLKGSQFMVLTHFGEHALHHLFPTLDHGLLPQLNAVFLQTLAEFKMELRESNQLDLIIGQTKQLYRTEPNLNPPGNRL